MQQFVHLLQLVHPPEGIHSLVLAPGELVLTEVEHELAWARFRHKNTARKQATLIILVRLNLTILLHTLIFQSVLLLHDIHF